MARLVEGYLLLKLITAETAILRTALDGEVGMVVAYADTHRGTLGRDVALLDVGTRKGNTLVRIAFPDQKLTFYFYTAHCINTIA